jgi:hypothetical protein
MTKWVLLALLAQGADASVSCYQLAQPHRRELNPLLPSSCAGIVAVKAAALTPLVVFHGKHRTLFAGAMLASGVAGVTVTLVLTR